MSALSTRPAAHTPPPPAAAAVPAATPPTPALLTTLPPAEFERLLPSIERVSLALKQVLYHPNEIVRHVYFPLDAVVSVLTVMADGTAVETGMVGREGMVGLPVFLGTGVGEGRAVCQVPGDTWRLPADAFLAALDAKADRQGALRGELLRYTQTVLRLAAQSAACNALHVVEARCARWLLLVGDRVGADRFPMTQLFLSEMLGVRRASVVEVMGTLTRAGLLAHDYGHVTLLDRPGLEAVACECYQAIKADLARVVAAAGS